MNTNWRTRAAENVPFIEDIATKSAMIFWVEMRVIFEEAAEAFDTQRMRLILDEAIHHLERAEQQEEDDPFNAVVLAFVEHLLEFERAYPLIAERFGMKRLSELENALLYHGSPERFRRLLRIAEDHKVS